MTNFDRLKIELVDDNEGIVIFKDDEIQSFKVDDNEIKINFSQDANRGTSQTFDLNQLVKIEVVRR